MKKTVDQQARRLLPDFHYQGAQLDNLWFEEVHLNEVLEDITAPDEAGLVIRPDGLEPDGTDVHYLATDWSRHQLLQALGTKEKWFDPVSVEQQCAELNMRRHVLEGMVFRTMLGDENLPVRTLRGIVSSSYTDIPNVEIMKALTACLPAEDTYVIRRFSGLTDMAMYAYIVLDRQLKLTKQTTVYPGLIFKNSEVGYTSLWVIPFLYFPKVGRAAVLEQKYLLRRIHRGQVNDMQEKFEAAIEKAQPLWDELADKIPALMAQAYVDEVDALEHIDKLVLGVKGTRAFAHRCRQAYQKARYQAHNAYNIFECICEVAGNDLDQDASYTKNAVAGAVLISLAL